MQANNARRFLQLDDSALRESVTLKPAASEARLIRQCHH
jgi:hypothetical protein